MQINLVFSDSIHQTLLPPFIFMATWCSSRSPCEIMQPHRYYVTLKTRPLHYEIPLRRKQRKKELNVVVYDKIQLPILI